MQSFGKGAHATKNGLENGYATVISEDFLEYFLKDFDDMKFLFAPINTLMVLKLPDSIPLVQYPSRVSFELSEPFQTKCKVQKVKKADELVQEYSVLNVVCYIRHYEYFIC